MANKKYMNISGKKINVSCKPVEPNEIIESNNTKQEIKNLVKNGYLKEIE